MVKIEPSLNGSHENQDPVIFPLPSGWAVVNCETPNFPFGTPTVEDVDGILTVINWQAGVIPEPEPPETPQPTIEGVTLEMLADHEYRLSLIELGLTPEDFE